MPPNLTIQTTTNQFLAPYLMDLVLRDNLFMGRILSKPEKWKGAQMLFPIKYQKGIASVPFNGFDLLPITQQPTQVNMTFYPSFVATNVALAGTDISQNQTEGNGSLKTLDLLKVTMESRTQDAVDDIGNYLVQGDGTGAAGKAPMGLIGIVDNGSDLSSYGGLSRSTYSGLNATVISSSGSITLLQIRQLYNNISDGPVRPDMVLTDYTTWSYVENIMTAFERNTITAYEAKTMKDGTASGYGDLVWDGMVIYRDKKVTTGYFYELNLKMLKFYSLKWYEAKSVSSRASDIEGNVYEDAMYDPAAWSWTGWIKGYNLAALNGFLIWGGQLICTAPFRQGVLTGITSS